MASTPCLRCLRRSLRSIDGSASLATAPRADFSTTSPSLAGRTSATQTPKKKGVVAKPTSRQGRTLHLKKNVRVSNAKPPAPGERKAVRKRIVLSNTNALEVPGLQDLTADKLERHDGKTVVLDGYRGQVLGVDNHTVDALRALEAFKPTQGWSLFRRPASLVREETAKMATGLADAIGESGQALRKVIFGSPGSGKSVLLLQAQAMAYLKGWVVVHFPEAQDLVNAQTSFQPLNMPDGTIYIQPHYTAKLLMNISRANQRLLSTLRLSKRHQLPIPIQHNMSLARFAELGGRDPELAWPIWQALWSELSTPSNPDEEGLSRPPVFVSMDGVDQAMRTSAYLSGEAKPIHAHDLALVRHFTGLLSGQTRMPNGGAVVAATCASNRAASPTLDYCLKNAHTSQANARTESNAEPLALPEWDPYVTKDHRVENAMKDVQVLKLQGLSKEEARGVMEYYARSGMLRGSVTEGLVSEKWTLAGSGIIGELEKGAVRVRF